MPFPPTFTNVWDITTPPDTQAANLLGLDIRNLKNDVMQRMSLLAGTFANRPTPEILNAVWGGAGFGLLYFATDTRQIFQWSGAAWVDITTSFIASKFSDLTQANFVNPAGLVTLNTVTVPGNFTTNGVAKIHVAGQLVNVAGTPSLSASINGVGIVIGGNPGAGITGVFDIDITLLGLSTTQLSGSISFRESSAGVLNLIINSTSGGLTFPYVAGTPFNVVLQETAAFTGTVSTTGMTGYSL